MIKPDIFVTMAQSTGIQEEAYWIIATCALLILVLVAALVLLRWLKRRQEAAEEDFEGFFTLQDLRDMRTRGDISQIEYNKLRDALVRNLNKEPEGTAVDPVVWEAESEDGEVVWEVDREEDGGWSDTEDDNQPHG